MNKSYQLLVQTAAKNKKQNQKIIAQIKKRTPHKFDYLINQLHDQAFEEINCLECANCCKTTGPLLLNKDIDRLAKATQLRPAVFTEKYLRIDEDRDYVFNTLPCPFLGSDNHCNVYSDRPNACREYPHTQQRDQLQKLPVTLKNSTICPAVAKVFIELPKHL